MANLSSARPITQPKLFILTWVLTRLLYWGVLLSVGFTRALIIPSFLVGVPIFAWVIGAVQYYHLQKRLAWEIKGWHKWTMLGVLTGLILGFLWGFSFVAEAVTNSLRESPLSDLEVYWLNIIGYAGGMVIFRVSVAFAQFFPLRLHVRNAWLWIIANLSGGLIVAFCFYLTGAFPSSLRADPTATSDVPDKAAFNLLLALTGILLSALLNALTLVWFSQRRGKLKEKKQN